jgi:hypothetical protein
MLAFLHRGLGPGPLFRPAEQRASDAGIRLAAKAAGCLPALPFGRAPGKERRDALPYVLGAQ